MMDTGAELSGFLRSRRDRLRPGDVGLVTNGRRRVRGLRREEVAQLAGVSITHYTRLEQGNSAYVSDDVLDAVAGALRLTDHERTYLHRLVRAGRQRIGSSPDSPALRAGLADLLEMMVLTPALVVGHRTEVVGVNRLCVELIGPLPATLSEAIFLDEGVRRRIAPSWETHAWYNVAFLRGSMARRPGDDRIREHVATMRSRSEEFAELWGRHDVVEWTYGERYLVVDHPVAGRLALTYEHMVLPGDQDLYGLMLYTAPAGSPERAALRALAESGWRDLSSTMAAQRLSTQD